MLEQLAVYLINLDRASERLLFTGGRLQALGIHYTRIAAIDGAALTNSERQQFVALRPRDGRRGWRPGQIGCFLSHFDAWQRIAAAETEWTLILEDDLHLSDLLPTALGDLGWVPPDAELVRLETTGQWLKLSYGVAQVVGSSVRRVRSPAWGAGAYLLSRSAANKIMNADFRLHSPVDDFLFNVPRSEMAQALRTYQLVPALAAQDKFADYSCRSNGFGSDIETDVVNARLSGIAGWRRAATSFLRGKTRIIYRQHLSDGEL